MKCWKRIAALAAAAALCMGLLSGCGEAAEGVALSVCAGSAPESLDPIYATAEGDQTILTHLYENLMRVTVDVSGDATVSNGMAKSVDREENYDGTVTWTFRLRSAKWTDGRSVKARDFVYAWQRLADPANGSPYAELLSVVAGYDQVRATGDAGLLQVSAKNDSTLIVELNGSYDWFLTEVCTAPATMPLRQDVIAEWKERASAAQAAREAGETPAEGAPAEGERWWTEAEALVTNGPYAVSAYTPGERLSAHVFEKYSGGVPGPAELTFRFADTAEEAWTLYENKEVDFVWELPESRLAELAADESRPLTTKLGVYTVLFNCGQELFTDPVVRQALAMTVDRGAAAAAAGGTAQAAEGLVSPGVPGGEDGAFRAAGALLDNDPERYAERCAQARELLEAAGYDRGRSLDGLEYLYVEEGNNAAVAKALTDGWQAALGVSVTARGVTAEELAADLAGGAFFMAGADFRPLGNDAECFLKPWTSGSGSNVIQYTNSAFDTLMTIIASAEDGTARLGCLHDAEALLLEDGVLAPLYTTGTAWKLRDDYTGVCRDARGWFCFGGATARG